jgi:hypothetical protein
VFITQTKQNKYNNIAQLNKNNTKQSSLTFKHHAIYHRDNKTLVPEDTPVPKEADNQGDTLFSFWNDLMSEKFDEEGDGVLFALHRLQASITGTLFAICMLFISLIPYAS